MYDCYYTQCHLISGGTSICRDLSASSITRSPHCTLHVRNDLALGSTLFDAFQIRPPRHCSLSLSPFPPLLEPPLQMPHPTHPSPLSLHATATVAAPYTPHYPVVHQMYFAEQQQPQPVGPILQAPTHERAVDTCARSTACTPPLSPCR